MGLQLFMWGSIDRNGVIGSASSFWIQFVLDVVNPTWLNTQKHCAWAFQGLRACGLGFQWLGFRGFRVQGLQLYVKIEDLGFGA